MMSATEEVISVLQQGEQDQTTDMVGGTSRGVESHEYPNEDSSVSTASTTSNVTTVTSHDAAHGNNKPRFLQDLTVSAKEPEDDIAAELCEKLYEPKTELILRIVKALGGEKAIELFKETQKLEEAGGMMVKDGTRRRTSGGIFIFLLSRGTIIPQEKVKQILKEGSQNHKRKIRLLRANTSAANKNLLRNQPTDSEKCSVSSAAAGTVDVVQSEQEPNSPPSPVTDGTDASDSPGDAGTGTGTHTDGHVDDPRDPTDAPIAHPDDHVDDSITTSPMERNRIEQVAFIRRLWCE